MSPEDRFWSKIDKTGTCWTWTPKTRRDGYGYIYFDGTQRAAHRVSYSLAFGPIPEGMLVDHICHTKRCVRPEHLRLADHATNAQNRTGANSNSKTGVLGVYKDPCGEKFIAQVWVKGKRHYAGLHETVELAEKAVIAKRLEVQVYNDMDRAA